MVNNKQDCECKDVSECGLEQGCVLEEELMDDFGDDLEDYDDFEEDFEGYFVDEFEDLIFESIASATGDEIVYDLDEKFVIKGEVKSIRKGYTNNSNYPCYCASCEKIRQSEENKGASRLTRSGKMKKLCKLGALAGLVGGATYLIYKNQDEVKEVSQKAKVKAKESYNKGKVKTKEYTDKAKQTGKEIKDDIENELNK